MKIVHIIALASAAFASAVPPQKRQDTTTSTSNSITTSIATDTASVSTTVTTATSSSTATSTSTACAGNTASDRTTWCDYDISTDYYNIVPDTGVTREYWFSLVQETLSPDGYARITYSVNGSIPGPTIFADWGDTVVIHVANGLTESTNGTSIHWHGIRQNYTNQMDGVTSITQCPTAPGDSYTYTWRATQYGSSWYHSHIGLQAWEGVFGGIVINGPATANYDEDLGNLFLNDWSHQTSDELYLDAQLNGPPTLDNGLINGTNVYGDDGLTNQTGSRFSTTFESEKSYRLRLVNGAIDTHFKFSIDNHTLTVIANDFVPITPYNTTVLDISMGQRYDIIVTADQSATATDFWMRAIPQVACSDNDSTDNIKGIVHYDSSTGTPSTTGYTYTDGCVDEALTNLVPYLSKTVASGFWDKSETVTVAKNSDNLFRWYLNETSMVVEWSDPTLLQVYNNDTTYTNTSGVIELPNANEWAYVIIQTTLPIPHPIHLHGHDFFVVAQDTGTYDSSVTLNLENPPRRDVAILPSSGYLVLAFETDNPGAWLMHCHIGWHTDEGFAIQFIERYSEISPLINSDTLNQTCSNWNSWVSTAAIVQEDSGV